MTANQLKAKEIKLKEEELEEKKRTGRADRFNKFAKGSGDALKGVASLIGANDPSWYNLDKALVNDVAQLPYGRPIGIAEDRASYNAPQASNANHTEKMAYPGVMRLEFAPTIGHIGKPNQSDAINVAARNIYSFIRHANSGSRNYDAPDFMQYVLSMDSIYTLLVHYSRAYSIALTAKSNNRYWPTKLLNAAGFQTEGDDSILNNLAQFRALINMGVQKAGIFNVPAKFPYFNRHMWLAANIFKDGAYKRCRNYVFVPSIVYPVPDIDGFQRGIKYIQHFNATNVTNYIGRSDFLNNRADPEFLTHTETPITHMTFSQARDLLNKLIDEATGHEDYGIMSGDVLKAFGDSGVFKLTEIGEDYHIESVYSPEVLTQVQGACLAPGQYEGAFIGQDTNGLIYQGTNGLDTSGGTHNLNDTTEIQLTQVKGPGETSHSTPSKEIPGYDKVLINMYKDEVTPDDNMVATRLSCTYTTDSKPNNFISWYEAGGEEVKQYVFVSTINECASEFIEQVAVFCNAGSATYQQNFVFLDELFSNRGLKLNGYPLALNSAYPEQIMRIIETINAFEWAPKIFIAITTDSGNFRGWSGSVIYNNTDLANYINIGSEILKALHSVALLSLFAVPLLGNTARKY